MSHTATCDRDEPGHSHEQTNVDHERTHMHQVGAGEVHTQTHA